MLQDSVITMLAFTDAVETTQGHVLALDMLKRLAGTPDMCH